MSHIALFPRELRDNGELLVWKEENYFVYTSLSFLPNTHPQNAQSNTIVQMDLSKPQTSQQTPSLQTALQFRSSQN